MKVILFASKFGLIIGQHFSKWTPYRRITLPAKNLQRTV